MKTRIIEVTTGDSFHYELQLKEFFFWKTVKNYECGIDGSSWEEPKRFESIDDINLYVDDLMITERRKVV